MTTPTPQNNSKPPVAENQPPKKKQSKAKTVVLLALVVVLLGALATVAKNRNQPSEPGVSGNTVALPSSTNVITVGAEYAFPGTEKAFAEAGIKGIKFYPETYTKWDQMQKGSGQKIDFTALDDMVKRYQNAGVTSMTMGIRYDAKWASIDGGKTTNRTNGIPKPEYMAEYDKWLSSVIERYDGDGKNDMVGLKAPIQRYEIGVEFSTYVPEPTDQYIAFLVHSYTVAHAAYDKVQIAHAAFLTTNVFNNDPTVDQYATAFKAVPDAAKKTLADIRMILDHPEAFDVVNFHSIGDPTEIDKNVVWLKYEMKQRNYAKPIIVSDTSPNPFIAWGPANTCTGFVKGAMVYPATEADRCRIAAYFTKLLAGDSAATTFVRQFVAEDTAKKVVIAAANGVSVIDTSFTEDIEILKAVTGAGAGNAGWGGLADVDRNIFTQVRTIKKRYPNFYALQQIQKHLAKYDSIARVDAGDKKVRIYEVKSGTSRELIAWYEPGTVYLPGEAVPQKVVSLPSTTGTVSIEKLITGIDKTTAEVTTGDAKSITLTPTPLFIKAQ